MKEIAIKVEHLGKLYRLGEIGTGTLSHDLNRWWARVRGKEDPFARVGEENDRTRKGKSDYVWSLKDINFEVRQGEVLGIIGRNGAGKSTLLKILSKVTAPTQGRIKLKGRIASLLEVGTGFHPELTGRENIFLNGAILGMTKAEIRAKFDEIVDFSGVERYIDTPVKRYSSGMYVRLAFAVAAFLEPEILIIDEVLAVGDAEFQKKCLGRMKDVSVKDGRTVLFVSHNMGAIKSMCQEVVILKNGNLDFRGNVEKGVDRYIALNSNASASSYSRNREAGDYSLFDCIEIGGINNRIKGEFAFEEDILIHCHVVVGEKHLGANLGFRVHDNLDRSVFTSEITLNQFTNTAGPIDFYCVIPGNLLMPNTYKMQFAIHVPNVEVLEVLPDVIQFTVLETGTQFYQYAHADMGCVFVDCKWHKG